MTILRTSYVLAVRDLAKASAHWRDVLGFEARCAPRAGTSSSGINAA